MSINGKPWPIIAGFLASLPTGSLGLDSGTGNGKYLPLPNDRPTGSVMTIGLDRSRALLDIAKTAGGNPREVILGNVLNSCWRSGIFVCPSTGLSTFGDVYDKRYLGLHNFNRDNTPLSHTCEESRSRSGQFLYVDLTTIVNLGLIYQRLIESVSPERGRVLIYVWAVEQDEMSKRVIPRPDSVAVEGRDVFVPWVSKADTEEIFRRYYHMFENGELTRLVKSAATALGLQVGEPGSGEGIEIVQNGWERSNYYVELRRWKADNTMH